MRASDRELLELAAKAAGLTVEWREWVTSRVAEFGAFKHTKQSGFWLDGKQWNPLTDDGDALRLAVALGMTLTIIRGDYTSAYVRFSGPSAVLTEAAESHNDDPYAATRRSIVRAAAEIGRSME